MSYANRAALFDIAAALLAGADAPQGASRKGLALVAPSHGSDAPGEPVRRDRRSPGQGSFHVVTESAERARLLRAELAGARCASRLGWKAVALGAPTEDPEEAAMLDMEIALEERPAALIALGWFPGASGGADVDAHDDAYIAAAHEAARKAGAPLWALAASREPNLGFSGSVVAPKREPSQLLEPDSAHGAPIAFRVLLVG